MKLFLARTAEQGSRNLLHAALGGADTHGQYISDCGIAQPSRPNVTSEHGHRLQERVWKELTEKIEGIKPGIMKNL